MEDDSSQVTQMESRGMWNQARRKAFLTRMYSALGLSRHPVELLSFEEVQNSMRLTQSSYRGLQQVPMDQVVGSVGRYNDFTRTFLPLVENDSWRWRKVAELQAGMGGLPPVELYKVGDAYFVKDGNHRVSVARQFGANTVEAYVWEYESPVGGLSADAKVDDLIVKAEYRAFLDRTRLDVSRPEQKIVLTEPGMYPELELQIALYRENLQRIDGNEKSYEDAAIAWYDMVYTLAVDQIEESGVLELFPGRTEADLYVWVSRNRRELEERYGERVSLREAVNQLAEAQQKPSAVERVMHTLTSSVMGLVHSLTPSSDRANDDLKLPVRPGEDEPLGKLLAQVNAITPHLSYQGQRGDDWRWWRGELRGKVWELLGMSYTPGAAFEVVKVNTSFDAGVRREKILLQASDGLLLPAYVMVPVDLPIPAPALLVYPGHGTIQQTAGLERSSHHASALALAQQGYITLTIEERGFGELGQVDHVALNNVAQLMGRSWLGITLEDGMRALDYLQTRPDVKPTHIGVTGLGLGGGLAMYTAALDERIRAVVIQNYLSSSVDPAMLVDACDFVPGLRHYAGLSDVARLIVPRPVLYAYPKNRATTHLAHEFFDRVRPSYEMFSVPDRTRFIEHDEGDDYDTELAQMWYQRWLEEEDDTGVLLWAAREG